VDTLRANPQTYVYVDAGHSAWVPAQTMVDRLRAAGVTRAHGFSLNVSNFQPDSNLISYGEQISAGLGGTHFVIDSSRNGLGVTFDSHSGGCPWWLNPPGRALGKRPTTETGHPLVDAYLWVKYPGGSDGNCGPYPPAGTWMPEYALGLAQRAAY
jgi:endoglucanase